MERVIAVVIAAWLILIGHVPCTAQDAAILKGDEIDRNGLDPGAHAEMAYASPKIRVLASRGYMKAGTRVRVSIDGSLTRSIGTVAALEDHTLLMVLESGDQTAIPLASIERLEVSRGRASTQERFQKGAFIGFLSGALYPVIILAPQVRRARDVVHVFIIGAIWGVPCGAIGALIGAASPGERWEQAPLPVRVGIAPQRKGGIALSASLAF